MIEVMNRDRLYYSQNNNRKRNKGTQDESQYVAE